MNTMTVSGFRRNMSAALNRAADGENVMVRRGAQVFAIIPVRDEEITVTPALQARIDKAREEYRRGETLHFDNVDDMHRWMDSL